jgi:hypothetical protein
VCTSDGGLVELHGGRGGHYDAVGRETSVLRHWLVLQQRERDLARGEYDTLARRKRRRRWWSVMKRCVCVCVCGPQQPVQWRRSVQRGSG